MIEPNSFWIEKGHKVTDISNIADSSSFEIINDWRNNGKCDQWFSLHYNLYRQSL